MLVDEDVVVLLLLRQQRVVALGGRGGGVHEREVLRLLRLGHRRRVLRPVVEAEGGGCGRRGEVVVRAGGSRGGRVVPGGGGPVHGCGAHLVVVVVRGAARVDGGERGLGVADLGVHRGVVAVGELHHLVVVGLPEEDAAEDLAGVLRLHLLHPQERQLVQLGNVHRR